MTEGLLFAARRAVFFTLGACLAGPALAAPPFPMDACQAYDQSYATDGTLMVVTGSERAHFVDIACQDGQACPKPLDAYVVPGDVVLASEPFRGAFCAYYAGGGGALTTGYLTSDHLAPLEASTPEAGDFAGTWREPEGNTIAIAAGAGGGLTLSGEASYQNNSGTIDAPLTIDGAAFSADDGAGCAISGRLRGPYLVVEEDSGCGGINVSFTGLYTKR